MKTCPVCKQTLTDTAKFCYFCGASVLDVAPEPQAPAAEAAPDLPDTPAEPIIMPAPEPEPSFIPEPGPSFAPEPEPEPILPPEPEHTYVPEPEPAERDDPEPAPAYTPEPAPASAPEPVVIATDSRSLMTTAGYIFTSLLFHIPVIGLIFMIVWGCGKTKNISRKRFSLAFLIMRLICYIVILAAAVFVLICFSGAINSLWEAVKPILFA